MPGLRQIARRAAPAAATLALFVACRDRPATADSARSSADASLAHDLAMAQRQVDAPLVFNDAPLGESPAGGARPSTVTVPPPAPRAAPRPAPRPEVRRASPPAPVVGSRRDPAVAAGAAGAAPATASGTGAGVIGAGTRVGMTTNGRVCAASALAGDKYTATVTSATAGSNGATIPAGSTVVIEVASVDRADPIAASRIAFRVRAIDVDGVSRSADGEVATLGSLEAVTTSVGNERTRVVGGAVVGAVLGRILGRSTRATVIGAATGAAAGTVAARRGESKDACLPDGSALQLTLSRDLVVRTSRL